MFSYIKRQLLRLFLSDPLRAAINLLSRIYRIPKGGIFKGPRVSLLREDKGSSEE